jgi:DNA polymerase-3 subunit epsilon
MKLALFYDTETSGLPLFNDPSEDPRQPHIVQLGALLVDLESRKTISSMDVIVRPDGWDIPPDVAAVHGITTEYATAVGIPERVAVQMFLDMWDNRPRIAHNETFDARILRIAIMRALDHEAADFWKAGVAQCTQVLSTPVLKLPPTPKMRAAGRNHFKSANLREAYQFFTGNELQNAHSAMADARACMEVFFAIQDGRPAQAA